MSRNHTTATITVRVTPNAKKNSLDLRSDGTLLVRITAPATEGKANKSLVKYLGKITGVRTSRISIVKGEKSRNKVLRFDGYLTEEITELLHQHLVKG